jgi:SSS family solute:Na+ symporter
MAFTPTDTIIFWVTFVAYLTALALFGVYSKKKTKSIQDFMVANRSIGAVLTGLSYGATYFSAVLLIGCPGLTWMLGSQWMLVTLLNLSFGTLGAFLILGNRTRRMSAHLGALTMPEMLAKRYQDEKLIRPTAGIVLAVFQTIYLVSIFTGLSLLLQILFPGVGQAAYIIAVILCGSITAIYLIIGGSHSAILSDLMESLIMITGLIVIILAGVWAAGGLSGLNANIYADLAAAGAAANATPPEAYFAANSDAWFLFPNALSMSMIGMGLVTTFGTWGSPQMSTRFFAAKSRRSIRYGMLIACVWVFVVSFCAWFAGYVGRGQPIVGGATASLKDFATTMFGGTLPKNWHEYTMPWLLTEANFVPLWMSALFLAGTTAASLTTGEKLILVASGSIARDFYQQGIAKDKNVNDEKTLKITRISVIGIVIIAVVLAINPPAMILDLCMFSWASLNAFTLIPFIAGLYWKGGTRRAALISGLIALGVAVTWFVLFNPKWTTVGLPVIPSAQQMVIIDTPWFKAKPGDIHEFIVSQLVAIPSFFIISILDKKGKPEPAFLKKLFDFIKQDTDE